MLCSTAIQDEMLCVSRRLCVHSSLDLNVSCCQIPMAVETVIFFIVLGAILLWMLMVISRCCAPCCCIQSMPDVPHPCPLHYGRSPKSLDYPFMIALGGELFLFVLSVFSFLFVRLGDTDALRGFLWLLLLPRIFLLILSIVGTACAVKKYQAILAAELVSFRQLRHVLVYHSWQ